MYEVSDRIKNNLLNHALPVPAATDYIMMIVKSLELV